MLLSVKKIELFLFALFVLVVNTLCKSANASTGWCRPVNGTVPYVFSFSKNVTDPNLNQAGMLFNDIYTWGSTAPSPVTCDCTEGEGDGSTYFKTETSLALARLDGNTGWYTVNEYLQASAKIYLGAGVGDFIPAPWDNVSNGSNADSTMQCDGKIATQANTGASGKISLYVTKPFVGESNFSVKLFDIYRSNNKGSFGGEPVSSVSISGMIRVPQNCIIDSGSIVNITFGDIPTSSFQAAGVKPSNVLPVKKDINIQCTNVAAQANLTMRIESNSVSDYSLVSDNPDVGFNLEDISGNKLKPNDINSVIPFTLDLSGRSMVTLIIYPVSITGRKPSAGPITSLGYLRVDFA